MRRFRTITEAAASIADRTTSPVALLHTCFARIEARAELNAFISIRRAEAEREAAEAAQEITAGHYRGPLHGIPVSIKDLVDVAGVPTTSGSAVPPTYPQADAPVVQRLRQAGAIIIGKTNLHEFAFGTTSDETAFGPVRNPFDTNRSAGGSSGGAAVAIVEGMCLASIGTDTGGSIRIPAAACGIVGLKPTFAEVPVEGVVPLSTTCDHVGPLTSTVADARIVFEALAGQSAAARSARPLTFGLPEGYLLERLDHDVRACFDRAVDRLRASGHSVRVVQIEHADLTPDVYLHIVLAEASEYHAANLGAHAERYSPGVRIRLEMGQYVLAEDYIRAMRLRAALRGEVDRALEGCDAIILPALSIPAPPLGAASVDVGGTAEPVRAAMLRLTQLFNLTGHPAIAVPAGRTPSGLPVGLQLVGRRGATADLLATAEVVEAQIDGGSGSVGGGTG